VKTNRSLLVFGILFTVILILPCSGATGVCNGVSYNKDIYRCEYGELIGKCKGKDYYAAYDQCINGIVVSGIAPSDNSGISIGNRGNFTDVRNGKTYKWVQIGQQVWMAENLNYNASRSICYNNNPANCQKYGRLYDWHEAMEACPKNWHLPIILEWKALIRAVGGKETGGKVLKAKSGWNNNSNGTDAYGFSALPGGRGYGGILDGTFNFVGYTGFWWSSSENNASSAYTLSMDYGTDVRGDDSDKGGLYSVRCVQD